MRSIFIALLVLITATLSAQRAGAQPPPPVCGMGCPVPVVVFTPAGGSDTLVSHNEIIDICGAGGGDTAAFNSTTTITSQFTYNTTNCSPSIPDGIQNGSSGTNYSLVVGNNTFYVHACNNAVPQVCTNASATITHPALGVTPKGAPVQVSPSQDTVQVMYVHNYTSSNETDSLFVTCTGSGISSCSTPPKVITALPGITADTVTYKSSASTGATGTLWLKAKSGSNVDSGSVAITVGYKSLLSVNTAYTNAEDQDQGRCYMACFSMTATLSTVPYTSRDAARSVTLVYNGALVASRPIIDADVLVPSNGGDTTYTLSYLSLAAMIYQSGAWTKVVFLNGDTTIYFAGTSVQGASLPHRLSGQFNAGAYANSNYPFKIIVTAYYSDGHQDVVTDSSYHIMIYNRSSSLVANGWTILGQDKQLNEEGGSSTIAIGRGSGSTIRYDSASQQCYAWGCTWAPPAGASVATQMRYVAADSSFGGALEVAYPDSSKEYYSSAFEWILRRISRQNDTVFYGYDGDDRVIAISDPYRTDTAGSPYNNHTYWHLAYGAYGLDSIVEPDALGNPGKGRVTLVRNDANAYLRSWTDPDGDSTTFGYDTQGRLDSITDRNGHLTRYVYNSNTWKIDSVISWPIPIDSNSTGSPVTASLRSFYSPPQTLVLPSGRTSATSPAPTIRTDSLWGYVVDNAGHTTQLQVDPWGQIIKYKYPNGYTYGYVRDGNGFPLSYSDTAGVQTAYTYSGPFLTSTTPAGQNTTHYGYGPFAQLDTIYGVLQPSQKLFIDTATWQRGHVDSVQVEGVTIKRYYAQHSAVAPGRDSISIDASGDTTTFGYDATTGNRNHVADTVSGQYTNLTFDGHGRVASMFVGGLNGSAMTTMKYDVMNRVDTVVNAKGKTIYGYDHLYQDSITDPNGRLYTTAYNAVGWATSQTDPTSRTMSTTYNGLGLPAVVTNRRNQPTTYKYDNLGRVLSVTRQHAFSGDADTTITFSYSFFSDTVVAQTPVVADTTFYSRSSGWADSSITGLNGKKFKRYYHHDAMGRVDSLSVTTTASNGIDPFTRHYYYNVNYGYLDSLKLRTQKITFAYNAIFQDTNVTYPTSVARHDAYTSTGATLTSAWTGLGVTMSRGYGYDSTGRIVEEDFDGNAYGDTTNLFAYDPIGELVQRRIGTWSDSVTCIIKKGGQGCIYGDSASVSVLQQDSTLWDAAGNLDSVKVGSADTAGSVLPGNRISTWTGLTFGSDSDGNRDSTNNGSTTTKYVWSSDGLLRQVISGSTTRTYDYDENGQLVRRSENGTPDQYYLWDQGQLIAILNSAANNRIAEFAYLGTDRPIARITGNNGSDTVHYYAQDAIGNLFSQWNGSSASVEQKLAYDPWGAATISTTTADTTQLRWKGLLYETGVTSLYYARARWYDPVTRRFVSADPTGLAAGINQYAFAGGDPINGSDPSGMDACDGGDDDGDYTECSPGGGANGPATTPTASSTYSCWVGGDSQMLSACIMSAQAFLAAANQGLVDDGSSFTNGYDDNQQTLGDLMASVGSAATATDGAAATSGPVGYSLTIDPYGIGGQKRGVFGTYWACPGYTSFPTLDGFDASITALTPHWLAMITRSYFYVGTVKGRTASGSYFFATVSGNLSVSDCGGTLTGVGTLSP